VKLWIIYKDGIGFSKMVAELLQDRLEDFIDVSVGNAKKIDPIFVLEEKCDYLIIGDVITGVIPSSVIQNWLNKYREIAETKNITIKAVSGFCIALTDITIDPFWIESLQTNINAEIIFPPILRLKLNREELALENDSLEIIKAYSNDFIEFFINYKKE
jgi:hypothetical protein